ncbi:hypothetical protein WJX74_006287 [Apatococcus lobatus]|uniref:Uncharacterized protein n=1 Tax=Apatococcus lobatus TaxID=904363 RepID=A0AAW1RWR5_9CHLO
MLRTLKDLRAIEPRVASVLGFLSAQPPAPWQSQALRPLASSTFAGPGYDQPGGTPPAQEWWKDEPELTATQACRRVNRHTQDYGPPRELQLRELLSRVRDSNDLERCLKAITLARQRRASFGQHQHFSPQLGACLAQALIAADTIQLVRPMLSKGIAAGIPVSNTSYLRLMKHFGRGSDGTAFVLWCHDHMLQRNVMPSRPMAWLMIAKLCELGRTDIAAGLAREYEENGIQLAPSARRILNGELGQ